jgi:hypothetical protein
MALVLCSAGFWVDVAFGNTVTFAFVAGALALRGSRLGAYAYIALCALMPRPVQLPLLVGLLWRRGDLRLPTLAIFGINAAGVLLTGYAGAWFAGLVAFPSGTFDSVVNIGPSRFLGPIWLPIGAVIAAILTWRGWYGIAGLALTPYLFPQYLLVALWPKATLAEQDQ